MAVSVMSKLCELQFLAPIAPTPADGGFRSGIPDELQRVDASHGRAGHQRRTPGLSTHTTITAQARQGPTLGAGLNDLAWSGRPAKQRKLKIDKTHKKQSVQSACVQTGNGDGQDDACRQANGRRRSGTTTSQEFPTAQCAP